MSGRSPFRLGLTGSIAMGKSTTAAMFRDAGVPVWDADEAVHQLYAQGGEAVEPLRYIVPKAVRDDAVDRRILSDAIARDPDLLPRVEALVHPLVRTRREGFIAAQDSDIVLLDIPLLFETGGQADCDAVVVVTAPTAIQRARALERDDMTEAKLDLILSKQIPDAEKRRNADYIIDTSLGLEPVRDDVHTILKSIREGFDA